MSVRIVTDSASDISQELAKRWGITVMPLTIRFGEEEFLDGVTLSVRSFFEKLEAAEEPPKTSQITPYTYGQVFEEAVTAGDEVLCFTLSSGVSGSYRSACMAADEFGGKVTVIDSRQFCISQYVQVAYAVRLRDEGLSAEQIAQKVKSEMGRVHVIAMFDTLEYLKKGGRLSAAAAFTGHLLSIKPVLTIEEGVVKILGKARGIRRGIAMMKEMTEKFGGIDFSRPVCLGYTGSSDEELRQFIAETKSLYGGNEDKIAVAEVGATIGTYAGPGAIALAFYAKA